MKKIPLNRKIYFKLISGANMRGKQIIFILGLIFIPFGFILQEVNLPKLMAKSENFYTQIKIFTSVIETIQRSYLEERTTEELIEDAIKGVVKNLDPHTVFLPVTDFKNWNQSFEGYTGIGISFEVINGKVTVMSILDSSPAEKHGIQPGDKILKINGDVVTNIPKEKVVAKLNGPPGLPVILTLLNLKSSKPREIQLIRERILLQSIPFALMVKQNIGYIKIDRFTSTTSRELDQALHKLKQEGMAYLVLDLRGNSGGYLNAAVEVTDKFIPVGNTIVTTKGRLASSYQEFRSTAAKTHELFPMIVLIDHGSASASEIVAGAIQDLDRGLIIGKTSFGKGLVQSQYRFHDGSALLITTAKYYTPSGRPIQRSFFAKTKDEYYREAYDDSISKYINNQHTEYQTLLGRKVYADGGIRPDIWIKNDNNTLSETLRRLFYSEKRPFHAYIETFRAKNPQIEQRGEKRFLKNFEVTNKILNDFLKFVARYDNIENMHRLKNNDDLKNIQFLLKREMAYMIWGKTAQFRVNSLRDKQLKSSINYFPEAYDLLSLARQLN